MKRVASMVAAVVLLGVAVYFTACEQGERVADTTTMGPPLLCGFAGETRRHTIGRGGGDAQAGPHLLRVGNRAQSGDVAYEVRSLADTAGLDIRANPYEPFKRPLLRKRSRLVFDLRQCTLDGDPVVWRIPDAGGQSIAIASRWRGSGDNRRLEAVIDSTSKFLIAN